MFRKIILLALLPLSFQVKGQHNYLIVGTYDTDKSQGIYVYDFNSSIGTATLESNIKSSNPSYLTVSPNEKYVYAVNENGKGNGGVSSYTFDKVTGRLSLLSTQPSGGDDPCYVATDKTGRWVAVANYSGGSLSVFPVLENGALGTVTTHFQYTGSSTNKGRQEKAHAHSAIFSPDNKYLFVQDLGSDKILTYRFNSHTGKLTPAGDSFITVTGGSGPRHIDFSKNGRRLYLMNELTGIVNVYTQKKVHLKLVQEINAAPAGFKGFMGSADIHISPDGKYLYCSNRGETNTITIFKIGEDGQLTVTGTQSTLGLAPRNFNFDPTGNYLLAANQNSNTIIIFKIDHGTGLLSDTGHKIEVGKPVCLKWINK